MPERSRLLLPPAFQAGDRFADHFLHIVPGRIGRIHADAERVGHRPAAAALHGEHLEGPPGVRAHPGPHILHRQGEQFGVIGLLYAGEEVFSGGQRVEHCLGSGRAGRFFTPALGRPARQSRVQDLPEVAAKPPRRVILKGGRLLPESHQNVLADIRRIGVLQAVGPAPPEHLRAVDPHKLLPGGRRVALLPQSTEQGATS